MQVFPALEHFFLVYIFFCGKLKKLMMLYIPKGYNKPMGYAFGVLLKTIGKSFLAKYERDLL